MNRNRKTLSGGAAVVTVALTSAQKTEAKEIHHGATLCLREYRNRITYCVEKEVIIHFLIKNQKEEYCL